MLDSRILNLEVGLPIPMPTYAIESGIDNDTRTREDKLFRLVYSRNKRTQSKNDMTTLQGQQFNQRID